MMADTTLSPGFYWISVAPDFTSSARIVTVGEWDGEWWDIPGSDQAYGINCVRVLSDRLQEPSND